jgi:ferritin-like metal-binding protein YciE
MEGLVREHDKFVEEEQPAGMICDMFVTGAGAKTEHYEIAAYSGLVESAKLMGQDKVAGLLQENLDQEKAALKTLESAKKRLSKEAIKNLAQA